MLINVGKKYIVKCLSSLVALYLFSAEPQGIIHIIDYNEYDTILTF